MKLSVRIKIDGLKRKIARAKSELPHAAEVALTKLAGEAIDRIEQAPESERRAFIARHIERQLKSVFVPVTLKHKRRELWPALEPLYRARIIRGQRSVGGRKRFYVDEAKEEALYRELVRRALAQRHQASYEVRFTATYDRRYRVEIIRRRGRPSARESAVMIAYARQNMRVLATDTLTTALSHAGLR